MAKFTPNLIGQITASQAVLNDNFDAIADAFDNTLSRDGSAPNSMGASIDMDSHRVYNLGAPVSAGDAIRLSDLEDAITGAQFGISEAALASQLQATTGTDNTTFMSPLRTDQHFVSTMAEGFYTEKIGTPSNFDLTFGGGAGGAGPVPPWKADWIFSTETDLDGAVGQYSTMIIRNASTDGIDGAGNTSAGLAIIAQAGTTQFSFRTHNQPGQQQALRLIGLHGQLSDQGTLVISTQRTYVDGVTDGGTNSIEGTFSLNDAAGVILCSNHYYMGGFSFGDAAADTYKQLRGFVVEGINNTTYGLGPAFSAIDSPGATVGFKWLLAGYINRVSTAPYAGITGQGHVDGFGRIRAASATAAKPGLSFIVNPDQGFYSIGATSFGAATSGVLRLTIADTAITSTVSISDPIGRLQALPRSTTAALAAIGNAINTANKFTGKAIINTTTGLIVTASGTGAANVWQALDGITAHTPV